jgi:hypothetical protein
MSKKHFIRLASCLSDNQPVSSTHHFDIALEQWQTDCRAIASACLTVNPRFDRQRFLTACGMVCA